MIPKYIAIEGVIGVGKTTLTRLLGQKLNATVLLELFEENPFLAEFYQDRARYAFQTQIFFLLSRYHQQHKSVPEALQQGTLISDYTFAKDELFAWLNLKDDELAMYGRVHAALAEKIPKPDLIVYLQAEHDVIMHRIMSRDRPYERNMDPGYIKELATAYKAWLANLQEIPVLIIDVSELDYVSHEADLQAVMDKIVQKVAQVGERPLLPSPKLTQGTLTDYQRFQRQQNTAIEFSPQHLMSPYLGLMSHVGKLAHELEQAMEQAMIGATSEAMLPLNQAHLREQLADTLTSLLHIANQAGIDLEEAYLARMRQ